ncbi:MAG: hypothetical protein PHW74_13150 [Desulfobacca sp.]|nr:hypothetical protein [Desulfobacca sp.]
MTAFEAMDALTAAGLTEELAQVIIRFAEDRRCPGVKTDFEWAEALQTAGATPEQARAIIQVAYELADRG